MSKKILIICGPTATGKTQLALKLAKLYKTDIISADSRQVYQNMDIGTGKDIPFNSQKKFAKFNSLPATPYYQYHQTKIWGYDLSSPTNPYSIADYCHLTWKIINYLHNNDQLPIIVGGSGLYLNSLINPPETIGIPPNLSLRAKLSKLTITDLQTELFNRNAGCFNAMNNSDSLNPRRLIRAIEISEYKNKRRKKVSSQYKSLWIGLSLPKEQLKLKIENRVNDRANQQFSKEIRNLAPRRLIDWSLPAFSATGYKEWWDYLHHQISKKEAIRLWALHEYQYARRQITWFKKYPQINWFDVSSPQWDKQVVERLKSW